MNSKVVSNYNNNINNINPNYLKESQIKEEPSRKNTDNSSIMKTLETNYLKKKKPFRATGLLNKSQLKLASFIKNHKDVTLQGTKRFMDKSGEYYLKNVQMQNRRQDFKFHKRNSLNDPQNLENCLNGNLLKIKKRASKIVTLLPENSLTPIPKKEGINKTGFANGYKKKELNDAQRTAVFIRRLEYATTMKKNLMKDNDDKVYEDKVILIQEWWRTMVKIIKLQKNVRGFIFRKKLMNNLEHQEKMYQFITEFDNIYSYHLFRQFMDNLKKKRDYEKAKYMEKCEDFGEKIENLEKMHNLKNLRKCLDKWNKINKRQKKLALDNLCNKLNNVMTIKLQKQKLDILKKIENKSKKEEELLDDKIKNFREKKTKEKFIKNLIRNHKLNKVLNKLNDKNNKNNLQDAFDKLKKINNLSKATEKLDKLMDDKAMKNALHDLRTIYFVEKLNDAIEKHNDKIDDEGKTDLFNKLKDINKKQKMKNVLDKWNKVSNELNERRNIINKLIKYKKDELAKKAQEERNKLSVESGINDLQLIPEKKPELINFKFGDTEERLPKIGDMDILQNQLNNITIYNNIKKLKKYFDKWKSFIKKEKIKRDLIKIQKKKILGDKLRSTVNNRQKINNENILRKYFNKWKEITDKINQENLENFVKKLNDILSKSQKESIDELKKDAFETLQKNNDIMKGVEQLQKFMDNKPLKDAFNTLKKNAGMSEGFRLLDKICTKKEQSHKKELLDKLQKNNDIQKAAEMLDKLISDKIKKDVLEDLVKKSKQEKGMEILDEVIDHKLIKDAFERLRLNNNIKKACEILERIINEKLKEDTWKKLISMDFVDLLEDYENKLDKIKKQKKEKIYSVINKFKKLKKNENQNLLNKYLNKWNDIATRRKIKDDLVEKSLKKKAFDKWKNMKELKDIMEEMQEYNQRKKKEKERQNLLKNSRRKKLLGKSFKKAEKDNLNNLRKYFDIWKQKNKNIQQKERSAKNLLNIYKTSENNLLKEYLNKWSSNAKNKQEEPENELPKYKKKQKFKEKEIIIEEENNEFNPTYYTSKKNIFKSKLIPYKRNQNKENELMEQSQGLNYIEAEENEAPKIIKNLMKLNKYELEDNNSSSNEDTIPGQGETLVQKEKVTGEPRNYTSQSFFIDKNIQNNLINSKNYEINSYNKNILPMKMKGDFLSLIEQNPKILEQKNPRIQVTNATCDLDQIINNEENTDNDLNPEEIDNEIEKLNDNFIINKNKVLSKVIKNCDNDLYASKKPFKAKKDKWYSVGIPLNNNEAKWEFLNNIKGERGKNNMNKFELIQKETEPIKEDINYNKRSWAKRNNVNTTKNKDTSFKLREINFLQYYRSPMKSPRNGDNPSEIIRYDRLRNPQKRKNTNNLLMNNSAEKRNLKNKYYIDRSHGKIELGPKIKTIDYDNYNDDSD